jgi:hypothetical protein
MNFLYFAFLLCFVVVNGLFLVNEDSFVPESSFVEPDIMDIMLTDMNHAKCANISRTDFGFEYNAPTTDIPSFPIHGFVLSEPYGRNIIPIIIQYKKKVIKSIAIVDTGNPFVHLSEQTLKALGIVDATHANVRMHGSTTFVYLSTNHFKDVNVVGASFLKSNRLTLVADYNDNTVEIHKSSLLRTEL